MNLSGRFEHIYMSPPIDWWGNAILATEEESGRVLSQMPEEPRDGNVYKLYVPYPNGFKIVPIYLCKAENNGTVYIFSDYFVYGSDDIERVR